MKFEIVIGSVLGASEYVGEALKAKLEALGYSANCHFVPKLAEINLSLPMIVVTSTHGAGDLPENIQGFANSLKEQDLKQLKAIIIGLGDSSYDTFCEGSRTIESIIKAAGGKVVRPVFQIDVLHHPIPEDNAVQWLSSNIEALL